MVYQHKAQLMSPKGRKSNNPSNTRCLNKIIAYSLFLKETTTLSSELRALIFVFKHLVLLGFCYTYVMFTGENLSHTENQEPTLTATEREPIHQTVHEIESRFEGLSWNAELLTRWLKRFHNIDVDLYELESDTFFISSEDLPDVVPELPEGYGYKGGAARAILEHTLGLEVSRPRDLDLVYVGDQEKEDRSLSQQLAEEFMPDDYAHGYGVESLEEDYFTSRDFTLNEVLYDGQGVVFTKECLTDVMRNIVRFSDYVKDEPYEYNNDNFFVSPKLMAKALRLVSDARVKGKERARLADETESLREVNIDEFHMSLHLDRSLEQGMSVAEGYVAELRERGFLPEEVVTVRQAYEYLVDQTDFVFRCATDIEMQREIDFLEEESRYDEYDKDTYTSIVPFWMKV